MPEQALVPTQLFVSAPSWDCGHLMDAEAQDKVAPSGDVPSEGMAVLQRNSRRGSLHSAGPGKVKCPAKSYTGRARPCGQHLPDAAHIWSKERSMDDVSPGQEGTNSWHGTGEGREGRSTCPDSSWAAIATRQPWSRQPGISHCLPTPKILLGEWGWEGAPPVPSPS